VRDVHRPTLMMVSEDSPASFNAMAPPARRLWEDTRCVEYPRSSSPSHVAPHRTAVVISLSETRVGCFARWTTVLIGQVGGLCLMLCSRRANAATGHRVPPIASWCTTAPFVPFFVFAMQMVPLSAVSSVARSVAGSRRIPLHHRRISHFRRAIVRLRRFFLPAGVVYSPTRSR
jgi:hypothetical protein